MNDHATHAGLDDAPLGHASSYPERYDAGLLFPIPRAANRVGLGLAPGAALPFVGLDQWQAFELSWLDPRGKPVVRLARFTVPANSPNLIESKSWKLYLNGFNQMRHAHEAEVAALLHRDLSQAAGAQVEVALFGVDDPALATVRLPGSCIDGFDVEIEDYSPNPALLRCVEDEVVEETLHSHLLKSNCPVTGQPDWGSVVVRYRGPRLVAETLLAYLVSYRNHQDFHEHCVERIFLDLLERARPERLAVMARYTRRGGLDINPCRATSRDALDPAWLDARMTRQ
ncbi:NADPH-dependent 7-cyano-7-deazaguanine reductase QueF [Halotalea alkalilenta]|uniref:NADPH-dependent 7-cyano-7-deazaguanine reductase n=1 Tax=Halotalea alkalilenta TaxID=376489 RepID=A0A172YH98_9GAMM|nr:NADPH-dependent 7-cyano-7-deazaguanine reductase QueF [Halotalea alkalilenta]ANF58630.1 NADPH-dependent 7-cyano-7-deazaguanine reductase QueF [Halotalea alkalilenta]